ncbi:MAG: imidazole glycerol phosphate synthase subunit HisF, partial [Chitinophagia bacterium]|nr:imidazole glycerol phosphate synthase subunit HisF [Chitinophagia bacterium]
AKMGFAVDITRRLALSLPVPVIASGGGGEPAHFLEVLQEGADAALAASVFHFREIAIPDLKQLLADNGIPVRR